MNLLETLAAVPVAPLREWLTMLYAQSRHAAALGEALCGPTHCVVETATETTAGGRAWTCRITADRALLVRPPQAVTFGYPREAADALDAVFGAVEPLVRLMVQGPYLRASDLDTLAEPLGPLLCRPCGSPVLFTSHLDLWSHHVLDHGRVRHPFWPVWLVEPLL